MASFYIDKKSVMNAITTQDEESVIVDLWTKKDIRKVLSLYAHNPTDEQLEEVMKYVAENYHSSVGLCNAVFEKAYLELMLKQLEDS